MKNHLRKIGAAIFTTLILTLSASADTAHRPNIVFILVDDLRWDALSCMGHPVAKTPNIDRIAKEGATFNNFFVSIPLCSPSRSSFLTGQYAHTTGVIDNGNHSELSHKLITFPRLLHDAGYDSAFVGKWHMGNDFTPRPGFDYWVCLPGQGNYENPALNINGQKTNVVGYTTDIFNEHAIKFLKQKRDKPFVLYLSHKAVHGPMTPAERHQNLYSDAKFPVPPNIKDDLKGKPALTRPSDSNEGQKRREAREKAQNEKKVSERTAVAQLRCMASVDDGVGEIFKALEETRQLDNTMIIFTSDNGYFWGEHGLGDKRWAYEESIRDPLLIRYPALVKAGSKFDQFVMNIDIAPTLLELGGAPVPRSIEGTSFLPLFRDEKSPWRNKIFTEYFQEKSFSRTPTWQSVRTSDWKLIHYTSFDDMDEIYNLKSDPYELHNLINDPIAKSKLAELKSELKKFAPAK